MKKYFIKRSPLFLSAYCVVVMLGINSNRLIAENNTNSMVINATDSVTKEAAVLKPIKNTFESNWIMGSPTVQVPQKGNFEFNLEHRFGTMANGYSDCYGLFNVANVRIGASYVPINNVYVGFGFSGINLLWDGDIKIALLRQSKVGGWPVSITYYGNIAVDTRKESVGNFANGADRLSYFHSIMIARKFNDHFSLQASFNLAYFNNVAGKFDSTNAIISQMNNANYSIGFIGRYKINPTLGIIGVYDQPLTQNYTNNPHPNLGIGLEMGTSGHNFQLFFGNYQYIIPQYDATYNQNDYHSIGQWCFGFNLARRWNF